MPSISANTARILANSALHQLGGVQQKGGDAKGASHPAKAGAAFSDQARASSERLRSKGFQNFATDANSKHLKLSSLLASQDKAPRQQRSSSSPFDSKVPLEKTAFVDSGIGGAIAAYLVEGEVKQFGSVVCLPIGDKSDSQVAYMTGQMIETELVNNGMDRIIIACNTASTKKDEACDLITKEILMQDARIEAGTSRFAAGDETSKARIKELAAEIRAADPNATELGVNMRGLSVIRGKVDGIVKPTSDFAAHKAFNALTGAAGVPEQDSYYIVVDSTVGTAHSGQYPDNIMDTLTISMAKAGYVKETSPVTSHGQSDNFGAPVAGKSDTASRIKNETHFFVHEETGEQKSIMIQSRGNPSWVPAIENKDAPFVRLGGADEAGSGYQLALQTKKEADAVNMPDSDQVEDFKRSPDLNMLCCTHYPAMDQALAKVFGSGTEFLNQAVVVGQMVPRGIGYKEGQSLKMDIALGRETIDASEANDTRNLITSIFPDVPKRDISVSAIGPEALQDYVNSGANLAFTQQGGTADGKVSMERGGARLFWEQNLDAANPQDRSAIRLSEFARTEHDDAKLAERPVNKRFSTTVADIEKLRGPVQDGNVFSQSPKAQTAFDRIFELGRLVTLGEDQGLETIALTQEPGVELFNAAGQVAKVLSENAQMSKIEVAAGKPLQSIGIVTGFTVVDNDGKPVGGENDGPPGAMVMAKQILQRGTPVTLVVDTNSEASAFAAAKGMGLVRKDRNLADSFVSERRFANAELVPGLSVKSIEHFPINPAQQDKTVTAVKAHLAQNNTSLLISIERPSPNDTGEMSSMSGADISTYNANLSELFTGERPYATIGIGDGGNEIGTGAVKHLTRAFFNPDGSPVVKNGDRIAAAVETDHMVLGSVSNNAGVAMAIASEIILNDYQLPASGAPRPVDAIIEGYRQTILSMYIDGISIDGVTKENRLTVDGRALSRAPNAEATEPGMPGATHQDMFDQMKKVVESAKYEYGRVNPAEADPS